MYVYIIHLNGRQLLKVTVCVCVCAVKKKPKVGMSPQMLKRVNLWEQQHPTTSSTPSSSSSSSSSSSHHPSPRTSTPLTSTTTMATAGGGANGAAPEIRLPSDVKRYSFQAKTIPQVHCMYIVHVHPWYMYIHLQDNSLWFFKIAPKYDLCVQYRYHTKAHLKSSRMVQVLAS